MSVTDVIDGNVRGLRCVECKEAVQAHRASVNGMAAHFEHKKRNASCSLSDQK